MFFRGINGFIIESENDVSVKKPSAEISILLLFIPAF